MEDFLLILWSILIRIKSRHDSVSVNFPKLCIYDVIVSTYDVWSLPTRSSITLKSWSILSILLHTFRKDLWRLYFCFLTVDLPYTRHQILILTVFQINQSKYLLLKTNNHGKCSRGIIQTPRIDNLQRFNAIFITIQRHLLFQHSGRCYC